MKIECQEVRVGVIGFSKLVATSLGDVVWESRNRRFGLVKDLVISGNDTWEIKRRPSHVYGGVFVLDDVIRGAWSLKRNWDFLISFDEKEFQIQGNPTVKMGSPIAVEYRLSCESFSLRVENSPRGLSKSEMISEVINPPFSGLLQCLLHWDFLHRSR